MKRFICLFLSAVFIFESLNIANAEEQIKEEYYNINVEFSDARSETEQIQIMLKNNNIYINAEQIAIRLGYKIAVNDEYIAVYNKEKSDNVPYSMTLFYFDSTKIKHMIFNRFIDYEAVCQSVKNNEGAWIPLEQALLLMNSSYMIYDSKLLIDMPEKNIVDIYMDILKENKKYQFDFTEDIGLSETDLSTMAKASFLVQQLNGLLKLDGDAWIQAVNNLSADNSAFDKKYGQKFALLFCTSSDDEFKEEIKVVKDKLSLFNGNNALAKTINALDKQQIDTIANLKKQLKEIGNVNSGNLAQYNSTHKALETVYNQDVVFNGMTELYKSVQTELKNVTGIFDKIMTCAEVIGYLEEFINQDEFAVQALLDFLSDINLPYNIPLEMKRGITDYTNELKSNIANYSAKRYLDNNYAKLISKGLKLSDVLSTEATLMLIVWDLLSENIPFYKEGISETDSFMLELYSQIFMSDAFINYQKFRNEVFNNNSSLSPDDLYKITEYCYTYLKSCYINRQACLGTLTESTKQKIPNLIKEQEKINDEIAGYLVKLKNASTSNDNLCYGFLPAENDAFLKEYSNNDMIAFINEYVTKENIFELLPEKFIFSAGAGGWHTEFKIKTDGTFTGNYTEQNYYAKITNIIEFNGKFSNVTKVDNYIYNMKLDYLNLVDKESIYKDGWKYEYDTERCPYGFDNASEFMIYLPGVSVTDLPQEFLYWTYGLINQKELKTNLPEGYYGIYNVQGKEGFVGRNKDY